MIPLSAYQGKTVGVLGLGKSGNATRAALEASGAIVLAWDDGENATGALTHYDQWPWVEMAAMMLSPGIPLHHPAPHPAVSLARQHDCPVIGDVELLLKAQPGAFVIGITGTNGKSTTTALIGHILTSAGKTVQVGGNLGTPVLTFAPLDRDGIYVLELSSYQLELLDQARIHCACLLNITPDHLDRHGGMEGYIHAKRQIFVQQGEGDTAVIAIDDAATEALAREVMGWTRRFVPVSVTQKVENGVRVDADGELHNAVSSSPSPSPHGKGEAVRSTSISPSLLKGEGRGEGDTIDLARCPALRGTHNWQNAAVAYAACRAAGLEVHEIAAGMRSFPGLAHRMERVGMAGNVTFVNDSKATNADAAAKALGSYAHIYWIAGGLPKEGGITTLGAFFPRIRHAFLVGQSAEDFAGTLEGQVPYTQCGTLEIATAKAAELARAEGLGDATVLLSPAAASWDQWPNFEARGDAFRQYAHALQEKAA